MEKTLKVEGMMCCHCEARVKKVLEALPEVAEAQVSHETGTAVVTLKADVADAVLKKAVEDQDYKVTDIREAGDPRAPSLGGWAGYYLKCNSKKQRDNIQTKV